MARFLNNPATIRLLNTKWRLLLEPLGFDYGAKEPWVVPAGKVSDGPSVPWFLDWLTPRRLFTRSGYLHDDIRSKWTTGNASTDAFLRDAALAEGEGQENGVTPLQAYLIYLGVRIGTHMGYSSSIPVAVITAALSEYAARNDIPLSHLFFDHTHSEVRVIEEPKTQNTKEKTP